MKRACAIFVLMFSLSAPLCRAQFYSSGTDPASTKWNKLTTENFRIIYPRGLDSLATEYALALEKYREDIGRSLGFTPNQFYKKPMPVVLHPFNTISNGSVSWAPRIAHLFTTQDASGGSSMPWIKDLAIHESRHIAQMQVGRGRKALWPFQILTGQIVDGVMAGIYAGSSLLEGDAVTAETALTGAGRGRSASFLEYMMMSFDNGDFRDRFKWKYGSIKNYTPDYYKVGYLTVAGMRYLCDDALISKKYYDKLFSKKLIPFPTNVRGKLNKDLTGESLKNTFSDIELTFLEQWRENAGSRGPFIEGARISSKPHSFASYDKLCTGKDDVLYCIRTSLDSNPVLVRTGAGGESSLTAFSSRTSTLSFSPSDNRLYWSENVPDERWSLEFFSDIRYFDLESGSQHSLTKGKRYFNPSINPGGNSIAVSEYFLDGRTAITLIDREDGKVLASYPAPDSLQIVETAWINEGLFATAISESGFGIYACDSGYTSVLSPEHVIIQRFSSHEGNLMFICDLNGSNELYSFEPASGRLVQLTSSRYGVTEGSLSADGNTLYYSSLSPDGRLLYDVPLTALPMKSADFHNPYQNPVATRISIQEDSLKAGSVSSNSPTIYTTEPYHKMGHLLRFHSWAPLYVKVDEIRNLSADISDIPVGFGATAFFQNDLGTVSGTVGYRFPDSGSLKFTYSGLYPVIETNIDFNPGEAVNGTVSVYIPFNFSKGGWSRGLIPQIKYAFSDEAGDSRPVHKLFFSTRAYAVLPTATAGIYPKFGIGSELLFSARPGLSKEFSPNLVAYLYGYVPGIFSGHGIKLTAMIQKHLSPDASSRNIFQSVLPRGFNAPAGRFAANYNLGTAVTFNYALPFAPVEWHLRNLAYLRNFEFYLHSDCTWLRRAATLPDGNLTSIGCELAAHFSSLLGIHFDSKLGVTYSYNAGNLFETMKKGVDINRHYVGLTLSTSL